MSSRQICPACIHRENGIIDTLCVICDGKGYMYLSDTALSIYHPEVVAEAITITLEAAARLGDSSPHLSADRLLPVREALLQLRETGILDQECTTLSRAMASKSGAGHPAKALAAEILQEPILPIDTVLPTAEPYEYQYGDKPGKRGLPVMSSSGHPSSLARLTNPADPMGATSTKVHRRHRKQREARDLSAAIKLIPHMRVPYKGRKRRCDNQLALFPAPQDTQHLKAAA